ncbi:hypothetical protein [Mesorhizobium sp. WSM3860]|uniref:hypothetical protein n=1 Tax=Mesorhizobium sp. WSM3860 TaxID=2029403 RepID=UPI000BB0B9D0|nr:hypothetical protein [Mesorhizobium sp. WSM3860]PBC03978.1 hypothetical protein CK220_12765 [Mesorhizobium sp. WSM3860]
MPARPQRKKPLPPGPSSGKYEGANHADRWRKRKEEGQRWRLSKNAVIWALIVIAMATSVTLIVLKAI